MQEILVIGAGNFGSTLATELADKDVDVTLIERDPAAAQAIRDQVAHVIVADATNKEILTQFGKDKNVAVVSLGEKMDSSILITHFLKEIGIKKIIAKANSVDHGKVLRVVGATQVIYPERDEAIRLATGLMNPDLLDLIRVSDEFDMVEIVTPEKFVGKTIAGLNLRKKYGLQILAIRNPLVGKVDILPAPDYTFKPDDILISIGDTDSLKKLKE